MQDAINAVLAGNIDALAAKTGLKTIPHLKLNDMKRAGSSASLTDCSYRSHNTSTTQATTATATNSQATNSNRVKTATYVTGSGRVTSFRGGNGGSPGTARRGGGGGAAAASAMSTPKQPKKGIEGSSWVSRDFMKSASIKHRDKAGTRGAEAALKSARVHTARSALNTGPAGTYNNSPYSSSKTGYPSQYASQHASSNTGHRSPYSSSKTGHPAMHASRFASSKTGPAGAGGGGTYGYTGNGGNTESTTVGSVSLGHGAGAWRSSAQHSLRASGAAADSATANSIGNFDKLTASRGPVGEGQRAAHNVHAPHDTHHIKTFVPPDHLGAGAGSDTPPVGYVYSDPPSRGATESPQSSNATASSMHVQQEDARNFPKKTQNGAESSVGFSGSNDDASKGLRIGAGYNPSSSRATSAAYQSSSDRPVSAQVLSQVPMSAGAFQSKFQTSFGRSMKRSGSTPSNSERSDPSRYIGAPPSSHAPIPEGNPFVGETASASGHEIPEHDMHDPHAHVGHDEDFLHVPHVMFNANAPVDTIAGVKPELAAASPFMQPQYNPPSSPGATSPTPPRSQRDPMWGGRGRSVTERSKGGRHGGSMGVDALPSARRRSGHLRTRSNSSIGSARSARGGGKDGSGRRMGRKVRTQSYTHTIIHSIILDVGVCSEHSCEDHSICQVPIGTSTRFNRR